MITSTIFWGIAAILAGFWLVKVSLALFSSGLGLLSGEYIWDEESQKFVKK